MLRTRMVVNCFQDVAEGVSHADTLPSLSDTVDLALGLCYWCSGDVQEASTLLDRVSSHSRDTWPHCLRG